MLNSRKNKRGQVGESISWVVATIILIIVLIVFIYLSILLSKTKSFDANIKESSVDWINSKTQIAYSINAASKNKIDIWISQGEENG